MEHWPRMIMIKGRFSAKLLFRSNPTITDVTIEHNIKDIKGGDSHVL